MYIHRYLISLRAFGLGILLTGSLVTSVCANNIAVSNVSLTGQDTDANEVFIQFDLTWENSWRVSTGPSNWDAAWVFVKYRLSGGDWQHVVVNTSGHTTPNGSTIDTPSDGMGVFIYRNANGTGTVNFTSVQLKWNYGTAGLADNDAVDVSVFAIEMVHVPTGPFAVGDGVNGYPVTTINTADATVVPSGTGSLGGQAGGHPIGPTHTPPTYASFPNGYNAFYVMKYEVTQGQYAAFLTHLTSTQAGNRYADKDGENRHTILAGTPPNYIAAVPDRANNFMALPDALAYADWAALRPMTDLEFEKTCRGAERIPVANEYCWGTTNLFDSGTYSVANDDADNATVTNASAGTGHAIYSTTFLNRGGPARVGIFAGSFGTGTREETGAAFYGAMEMSGNLREIVYALSTVINGYTGSHGDGSLSSDGEANTAGWIYSRHGTTGGSYTVGNALLYTSRSIGITGVGTSVSTRFASRGFRAARSAQ